MAKLPGMQTWIAVALPLTLAAAALAGAGCRKEEPARRQTAGSGSAPTSVPVPAVAPVPADAPVAPADADAAPAADAGVTEAPWPTSVAVTMIAKEQPLTRTYSVSIDVPRFRTKPAAFATELNARFAQYTRLTAADVKGYQGSYYAHCRLHLVSRLAVIVECGEMNDRRTIAEAQEGTGGAPAGPTPDFVAVWLQPGLPPIELAQLAPGVDAAKVIATAIKGSPKDCEPTWCEYRPDTFALDAEGVVFRPTTYCSLECPQEHVPRIPLAELRPVHPWAVQLVDWIRKRAEAGQELVEGRTDP
ncbi:MAG TPA: hypothetical protein VNO30_08610 [Kofleriaceae bacterium]|nr:hypothetical protein [Kofleriaceae bacterium]